MQLLKRKTRLLSVRLSEEHYVALHRHLEVGDHRSVSEFVRDAITDMTSRIAARQKGDPDSPIGIVDVLSRIDRRLERLVGALESGSAPHPARDLPASIGGEPLLPDKTSS